MSIAQAPPRITRPFSAILRDLSAALVQQMFYWGMDAAHPGGNVFQKRGFRKSPSLGLKGTSCYSLPWQGGEIFLHGACVGWFPEGKKGGFLFIRRTGKCHIWMGTELPVPGEWPLASLAPVSVKEHATAITTFLSWLLEHEENVRREMGEAYRAACHRKYRSLPKSRQWLAPADGEAWLRMFLTNPAGTSAAKRFTRYQCAGHFWAAVPPEHWPEDHAHIDRAWKGNNGD